MGSEIPETLASVRHAEEQGAKSATEDVNAELEAIPLYRAFKPFFWSLKLCGLGFFRKYTRTQQSRTHFFSRKSHRTATTRITASWVYSFVIVALLVGNTGRFCWAFVGFRSLSNELLLAVLVAAWMFQCAVNAITMYRASLKYSFLPEFFLKWQNLHEHDFDLDEYIGCTKKYIKVILALCWLNIAIQMAFTVYNVLDTELYDLSMVPFVRGSDIFPYIQALGIVVLLYFYTAWILPTGFFFLICLVLRWEYKRCVCSFYKHSVSPRGHVIDDSIEDSRLLHQRVCQLVETADNMLTLQVGNICATGIIIITIIIYNMISWSTVHENPQFLAVHFVWLLTVGISLALTAIAGALVNHAVRQIIELILISWMWCPYHWGVIRL